MPNQIGILPVTGMADQGPVFARSVLKLTEAVTPSSLKYYTASESADATMAIVSTRCIAVTGMTCDHCASAIRAEISKLPGVTAVDVDVTAGTVRVCGDPLPGEALLREAVEEAGYEFSGG